MQRVIKFRAWDDGKMVYPSGALANINRFFRVFTEDAPIMQFTGLHDKNGVEIYEGDVSECKMNGIETHIEYVKAVVYYNETVGALGIRL